MKDSHDTEYAMYFEFPKPKSVRIKGIYNFNGVTHIEWEKDNV